MANELKFDNNAKSSLIAGMNKIAKAVGSTLGPKGQCVILDEYTNGLPHVTKDGVTVAKNIILEDKYENVGATLLKQAALSTVNSVGDATTTSTVLAYTMVQNAYVEYCNGIKNIASLRKGIKIAQDFVNKTIKEASVSISNEDIVRIATISSNNDSEIGELISNAFNEIGLDGIITVEESSDNQTTIDIINGMQFEKGFVSHWFVTDKIKGECVLENALVLLTDQKIQLTRDIIPAAEYAVKQHKPLLIIAQDFDDEVIQNMRINNIQGNIKCCLVKAPSFGQYRTGILEDIAILTGAQLATYDNGIEVSKITGDMLGSCGKIVVTKDSTTMLYGKGNPDTIKLRVLEIKNALLKTQDHEETMRKYYKERIARLVGGICVIKVGGSSELEMREKKDRIEDAVCATKAALEEGIVPGGGLSFLKAYLNMPTSEIESEQQGINIIKSSLTCIFNTIVKNAGLDPVEIGKNVFPLKNISWDANSGEYVDFMKNGIINPTKADRLAFENAIGVLNMFLSTNCIVINKDIFKQYN